MKKRLLFASTIAILAIVMTSAWELIPGVAAHKKSLTVSADSHNGKSSRKLNGHTSTTKVGAATQNQNQSQDDVDPDLPPKHARPGFINKEEYMVARSDYIASLRGLLPGLPFAPLLRLKALADMERQENAIKAAHAAAASESESNLLPPPPMPQWIPIGPAPIPNGQTEQLETPVSGRTTAIAVHPTNPDVAYVGTAQGGLYRTVDGGTTWRAIFDSAQSLAIGAVAIAPSDPSIVYVGTGEPQLSADSFFGVGLYRINNAQTTADLTGPINPPVATLIPGTTAFTGRAISKILVHPTDPATIFVGTASGTSGNPSGGSVSTSVPPLAIRGLYRSTNATAALADIAFQKLTVTSAASVAPDTSGNRNVMDMVFEPGVPNTMILTILGSNAPNDGGVWRTTNALAATPTFVNTQVIGDAAAGANAGRAELAINKTGIINTVYVASGGPATDPACTTLGQAGQLRKSIDGGVTWVPLPAGDGFCGGQCFYDIVIAVDPGNVNNVLLGGNVTSACSKLIAQSLNGGASFGDSAVGVHADNHVAVFAPSNPMAVYMGTDGGIYKSTNGGASFTSMNNTGFSATQFQAIALHPTDRQLMIGGTQDNGTELRRPDGSWTRSQAGDGGYALIDQNAVNTTQVTMYHTFYNQSGAQITWERSTDAGATWTSFNCGSNGIACADNVMFYAPIALGPGTPNTLYFGTDRLYRSTNGTIMSLASQEFDNAAAATGAVSTIGISRQDDNVRIVGLRNGKVFATTTGANPMTNVTSASFPPLQSGTTTSRPIGRAVIDPNNKFTAYVTFGGYGVPAGQHVWKTTDLDAPAPTWAAAGNGIPDVPVNAFVVDPEDSNNLFAGTDIGVYASFDGGANWAPYGTGLPRVAVFDIAIQNVHRVLRIGTHGRGIWEVPFAPTLLPPILSIGADYENPDTNGSYTLNWVRPSGAVGPDTLQESSSCGPVFTDDAAEPLAGGENAKWVSSGQWTSQINPEDGSLSYYIPDTSMQNESLTMKTAIPIPAGASSTLTFTTRQGLEDGFDYGHVEVSTDGGTVFTPVIRYTGPPGALTPADVFVGARTVDLSQFAGQSIKVRFRMTSDDFNIGQQAGWHIDNIQLTASVFTDVITTSNTSHLISGKSTGNYCYRVSTSYDIGGLIVPSPYSNVVNVAVNSVCTVTNLALSTAGAVASADPLSNSHSSGRFPALAAINGDRTGANWGSSSGGWNDNTRNAYPDILQVTFPVAGSINQINVFTLQNNWTSAGEPTVDSPATGEGILDFIVQYCSAGCDTGTPTWTTIPGGNVTGNDKAKREFAFPAVTTSKIRVVVNNSRNNWSRIVEVEAYRACL